MKLDKQTLMEIVDEALTLAEADSPGESHKSRWMELANIANVLGIGMQAEEYSKGKGKGERNV